jgi:hypothetical protein
MLTRYPSKVAGIAPTAVQIIRIPPRSSDGSPRLPCKRSGLRTNARRPRRRKTRQRARRARFRALCTRGRDAVGAVLPRLDLAWAMDGYPWSGLGPGKCFVALARLAAVLIGGFRSRQLGHRQKRAADAYRDAFDALTQSIGGSLDLDRVRGGNPAGAPPLPGAMVAAATLVPSRPSSPALVGWRFSRATSRHQKRGGRRLLPDASY